jgi:hypothetical protein
MGGNGLAALATRDGDDFSARTRDFTLAKGALYGGARRSSENRSPIVTILSIDQRQILGDLFVLTLV